MGATVIGFAPSVGLYACAGSFANGKPIAATMTLAPGADARVLVTFDEFSGPRVFREDAVNIGTYVNEEKHDRFAYAQRDEGSFDITYSIERDGSLHPVDTVHCARTSAAAHAGTT